MAASGKRSLMKLNNFTFVNNGVKWSVEFISKQILAAAFGVSLGTGDKY